MLQGDKYPLWILTDIYQHNHIQGGRHDYDSLNMLQTVSKFPTVIQCTLSNSNMIFITLKWVTVLKWLGSFFKYLAKNLNMILLRWNEWQS